MQSNVNSLHKGPVEKTVIILINEKSFLSYSIEILQVL